MNALLMDGFFLRRTRLSAVRLKVPPGAGQTSKKITQFPLDIPCERSVSSDDASLTGSSALRSSFPPRQRHWASAGFWWCGAMVRRHQARS